MINFPGLNGPAHAGFHELRRQASAWPTTALTPRGAAELLAASRDLFVQGYYAYALFAVGGTWSIFAVEVALRAKLGASEKKSFVELVKTAEAKKLLPSVGWENERLDAGRKLRNNTVHGAGQELWTPAMSRTVIGASHEAVAALFPGE